MAGEMTGRGGMVIKVQGHLTNTLVDSSPSLTLLLGQDGRVEEAAIAVDEKLRLDRTDRALNWGACTR